MNYKETINYLYAALPVFHRVGKAAYKANLDNTIVLDNYFGNPHKHYKTVHVAGTNGKGSVSHMIASVLQSARLKTGLYTSPHLFDFRERIKINGKEISEKLVIDFVEKNKEIIEELKPSFFEITSSMAFQLFSEEKADIAVIETGLGGRLDSTNIITPLISVITNIGLDHTEFLGYELESIAAEKAGIIKPCIPVVIGEKHSETTDVFINKASECNSPIYFAEECFEITSVEKWQDKQTFTIKTLNKELFSNDFTISVDLGGDYQKKNIITALTALAVIKKYIKVDNQHIFEGIANAAKNTALNGRWQVLKTSPFIICDTGHNAHGLQHTMQQLKHIEKDKLHVVLGVVNDKDLNSIIPLLPKEGYYYFTRASTPRSMDAEVLAEKCIAHGLKGEVVTPVEAAVQKAVENAGSNDVVFIGGSTFVVADIPKNLF